MASFDDLGRALRDDAEANAPRASAIDVDAVTRAARARRRPRQWAVGTLSVVAVLGFGGLAVAAVAPPVLIAASESADLEAGATDGGAAPLEDGADERLDGSDETSLGCGETAPSYSGVAVNLSSFALPRGTVIDAEYVGSVSLANTGSDSLTVTVPTAATGVLTRDGIVVSEPLPLEESTTVIELDAGGSWSIPVRLSTTDCTTGSALSGVVDAVVLADVTLEWNGQHITLVASPISVKLE